MNSIRYKIKNHKRIPLCDFGGECKNLAYREVYPLCLGGKRRNKGWSYLCRKHFYAEERRLKWKLPACSIG